MKCEIEDYEFNPGTWRCDEPETSLNARKKSKKEELLKSCVLHYQDYVDNPAGDGKYWRTIATTQWDDTEVSDVIIPDHIPGNESEYRWYVNNMGDKKCTADWICRGDFNDWGAGERRLAGSYPIRCRYTLCKDVNRGGECIESGYTTATYSDSDYSSFYVRLQDSANASVARLDCPLVDP